MSIHCGLRDQNAEQCASERDVEQLASFLTYLEQRGHRAGTAQAYRRAVAHFLHWRRTLPPDHGPTLSADQIRAFLNEHIPICRCPGRVVRSQTMLRAALNQFLLMDGQPRLLPPPPPTSTAVANQLRDFDYYLQAVCGLAEQTRRSRCRLIAQFLARMFGAGPVEVSRFTPAVLLDAIITWAQDAPPSTATAMVGALRSYLRCLCFQGLLRDDLAATLPAPACWPLTSVPPALSAAELAQFWSAFDRTTPIGQRDYAMARCLADLGLRCHEVADLTLEAIDWRAAVLTLRHTKSGRCDQLPLPSATGEALVAYLRKGRPDCRARALFVHHRAPLGAPVAKTTVRAAVRRAFERAGLPWSGTHVLRHTAARRMLQSGCSLKDIADVLRHRSLDTTVIYAKVDLPHLAQVALPWPEVRP